MANGGKTAAPETKPDRDEVDFTWFTDLVRRYAERDTVRKLSPHADTAMFVGALVVALLLGLWLTAGAWGGRPPSGEDTMPHLIRANFALHNLLPRGRIDGWDPSFILGYQEFLFIGPGLTWAVGAVRLLSLGILSTTGAFKIVFVGSFVVLPLAVAFFALSFGLSRRAAAIAAILTFAVNNPFGGVGLQGLFNVGLAVHQFGAIFFFLTLGAVLRLIQTPRLRWVVVTGVFGAALLVTHGISVILLGPLIAIVLLVHMTPTTSDELRKARFEAIVRREVRAELRRRDEPEPTPAVPEPAEPAEAAATDATTSDEADDTVLPEPEPPEVHWRRLGLAAALACALAACVLLPFAAHRNLRGGFTGWGTAPLGERIAQIWRGDILFRPGVAWLVLAGLIYGLYRAYQGKQYALAMVAAPVIYLALSHAALHLWPTNVAAVQLPNRGLGYVGVLAMLPLAAFIDKLSGRRPVGYLIAVAAALAIVILPMDAYRTLAREQGDAVPAMFEAADNLRRLVPDGARFVTERQFPQEIERTGIINPDRWLAWASGRPTLNNFNVESTLAGEPAFESEHIRDRSPEVIADALSRYGTTHLVTVSDEAASAMSGSSRFALVWSSPPLAIFEVLPKPDQPPPAALLTADGPLSAQITRAEPEAVRIQFDAARTGVADVAIAWSPKWHATLDGRPVPIRRGPQGLIQVGMPAGSHQLALTFRPDLWDYLGVLVTLATAIGLGVVTYRYVRNRRRSASEEAPPATDSPTEPATEAPTSKAETAEDARTSP
ncbi:MAG: hypothetical protein ACRD12_17295 [Acidimicrobiales bacterium]